MKNNLNFITFGCKLNAFETQVMKEKAEHYNQAVKQTRQAIRKERRENPNNKIVVTGCAAELHPNEFMSMPEVDCIIGNHEKTKLSTFGNLVGIKKDISEENIIEEDTPFIKNFDNRTRAFVQIQNGCDHRCTFCIIPYARGQSRSIKQEAIIRQIQTLLDKGYNEIILTGVDITSYGQDLNEETNLGILIKNIIKGTSNLKRLRISSIDSIEIDNDFLEVFASEKIIMPHLHLSLQSGNDLILKRMLRRHQPKDAIAFCEKVQKVRPESVFGADLIAGFPTESDSMHESTKKHIEDCNITYLHIFPYSAKEGTPAAKMPQVEKKLIQRRSKELREIGNQRLNMFLINEVGKEKKVLVEKSGFGRTEQYAEVLIPENNKQGELITKKIIGITKNQLMAELN